MPTVAVVGGGPLGGAIAYKLAETGHVREVRIIDEADTARGHALDIQQAGAIERFDTRVVGRRELHGVLGADLVIIAGPAEGTGPEYDMTAGLAVLERLKRLGLDVTTICAGGSHHALVERGVLECGFARRRLIGSAPFAYQQAIRALVAVELRCSVRDVTLAVLGLPPDDFVVPWNDASAAGTPITQLLPPTRLTKLKDNVRHAWPPASYALASAVSRLTDGILRGSGELGSVCTVVLDGELGVHRRAAAVSVTLDPSGVRGIREPTLNAYDRAQLESALAALP